MIQIPLKDARFFLVDEIDVPLVNRYNWRAHKDGRESYYVVAAARKADGSAAMVALHRLIISARPGEQVDHRDGNPLNNTRSNLRIATRRQNLRNRGIHRHNTSGYKGVRRDRCRWRAEINVDGRVLHLGMFNTREEGARAYDTAAIEHYGEFARLNFPVEQE